MVASPQYLTPEYYLQIEAESLTKHEYFAGEVWLYRVDYAAAEGKCQLMRQRNLNRSKFLNP